jgi:iron(II)-dependent oxidoreductase
VQDLAGNVSEWAADWYASSFSTAEARNPTGPPSGEGRVIRGSTWHDPAERLDASWRYSGDPNLRLDEMGFRCAMDAPPE